MSTVLESDTRNKKTRPGVQDKILVSALENRFISLRDAQTIAGNDKSASMALWRLTKKGDLMRIKEGLYASIPREMKSKYYEFNRYVLFDRAMNEVGGLAYHSALELHGAAYSSFNKLFYLTTRKVTSFDFQGIVYRPVWAPELFGITKVKMDGIEISVTDKERTFLDCLRRLDLCGGLEEYLKSVESFTLLNPDRLVEYLEKFGESSLYQRTGFVLSSLMDRIRVPEGLTQTIRMRIGPSPTYLVPGRKKTKSSLNGQWNLYVPDNFSEMIKNV